MTDELGDLPPELYDPELAELINDLHASLIPLALLTSLVGDLFKSYRVMKNSSLVDGRVLEDIQARWELLNSVSEFKNEKEAMDAGLRVVAFDLDGTLAVYDGWDGGRIGEPIFSEVNHLLSEFSAGSYIVLFTTRLNIRLWGVVSVANQLILIDKWLKSAGIRQCVSLIVGDKPLANEYRDDRSVNPTTKQ